jgi:mannosyltransferase
LEERQSSARRWVGQHWGLLAIILLAFVLRVYGLGRAPFWFDEALSGFIAEKGVEGIVAHTLTTPFEHPPLYYLVLHLWTELAGSGEFALRFFSLFWGVLLLPLLYHFVTPWGGRRLALLTTLVMAVSATLVEHAQNARMYSLVLVLSILSLLLFFRALREHRRLWWAAYLFVTAMGIAIHYYFALFLLVPVVLLLLGGPQYRRQLALLVAVLFGTALVGAGWLLLSPGPRQAMEQILRGEGAGVSSLALRVQYTIGGMLLEEPAAGAVVYGILALLGVLFWPLPPVPRGHPLSTFGSRRFLLLWLIVPWLAALAIPYWLQGRHLAYLWPVLFILVAAGLLALRARGAWLFALGLLLVGAISVYGLYRQDQKVIARPAFGQIVAYVEDRALPDDLVITNQPLMWPIWGYYAHKDLDVAYVPESEGRASEEEVAQQLASLADGQSRIWLGPISAWTADPDSLVERWLATNTFQADKAWFPESSSAALYFTAPQNMVSQEIGRLVWGQRLLLRDVSAGPRRLRAGDAVRLRFQWRAGFDLNERYIVELTLVDSEGRVWAERRSEPCADWCPTDKWKAGWLQQDQHALLVPPGTPPGSYHIEVAWVPLGGGPALPLEENGQHLERASVAEVTVFPSPAGTELPTPLPHELQATFGGKVTLLGYEMSPTEARPGDVLHLETGWRAEMAPTGNYTLAVELVDNQQRPIVGWNLAPAASFYPTGLWQPGEYLRGQNDLPLPNTLLPGRYSLRLAMLGQDGERLTVSGKQPRQAFGTLLIWQDRLQGQSVTLSPIQVVDRPRQFDLPAVEHPLQLQVGQQARLVGYSLDAGQARPGGQVRLTLYWQADGPMVLSFKVFVHLVDDAGSIQAQHDAVPGEGCCPTNTWVKGEIIVDEHPIALRADMVPGSYQLEVGMYDQEADRRLPVYAADGEPLAGDRVLLDRVAVEPAPAGSQAAQVPAAPLFEFEHKAFLPLVSKER